jgi:hypothetical protein
MTQSPILGSKRQKIDDPARSVAAAVNDYMLNIPFCEERGEEFLRFSDAVGEIVCWAPALVWMWKTENKVVYPHSGAPVKECDMRAAAKAASLATIDNSVGPASFLTTLDGHKQGKPLAEEEIFAMCSEIAVSTKNDSLISQRVLKDALLQGIACAHAYIVDACLLQNVGEPIAAIHSLSKTWVWVYDAIIGKLISLCPAQALDVVIGPSGHIYDFVCVKSSEELYSYNPMVLLPVLRHVVFVEEFVCRSALGTLSDDAPWRYTHVMNRILDNGGFSSAAPIRCSDFKSRPLGENSELIYPASIVHRDYEMLMEEVRAVPLVAPGQLVPTFSAQISATAANEGLAYQENGGIMQGGIFRFFHALFAADRGQVNYLPTLSPSYSGSLSVSLPNIDSVVVNNTSIEEMPDWGLIDAIMEDVPSLIAAHNAAHDTEVQTQSAESGSDDTDD